MENNLTEEIHALEARATQICITSPEEAQTVADLLVGIQAARKRWVEYWAPLKQRARQAWQEVCAREKAGLERCDAAEGALKRNLLTWQRAQEEQALAEQRRLQALAEEQARRERERLMKEAGRLKSEERKQSRIEEAQAIAAPVITVATPSAPEGVVQRRIWRAVLTNFDALVAEAKPGNAAMSLLSFNQKAADALARATKGQVSIPGVKFEEVTVLAVSTMGGGK